MRVEGFVFLVEGEGLWVWVWIWEAEQQLTSASLTTVMWLKLGVQMIRQSHSLLSRHASKRETCVEKLATLRSCKRHNSAQDIASRMQRIKGSSTGKFSRPESMISIAASLEGACGSAMAERITLGTDSLFAFGFADVGVLSFCCLVMRTSVFRRCSCPMQPVPTMPSRRTLSCFSAAANKLQDSSEGILRLDLVSEQLKQQMPSCSDVCDDCKRQRERQSSSNLGEQQMYTRQGPQGSFVDAPYYPGRVLHFLGIAA